MEIGGVLHGGHTSMWCIGVGFPLRACHEISVPISCWWGRRSIFVACLERAGWQATENDGLPHDGHTPRHAASVQTGKNRSAMKQQPWYNSAMIQRTILLLFGFAVLSAQNSD